MNTGDATDNNDHDMNMSERVCCKTKLLLVHVAVSQSRAIIQLTDGCILHAHSLLMDIGLPECVTCSFAWLSGSKKGNSVNCLHQRGRTQITTIIISIIVLLKGYNMSWLWKLKLFRSKLKSWKQFLNMKLKSTMLLRNLSVLIVINRTSFLAYW